MADLRMDFVETVYTVLVADKVRAVKEVAEEIGISVDSLYSRLNRRSKFSPEEVKGLIASIPDHRLASYLLDGSRYIPADRNTERGDDGESVQHVASRSVIEAAQVLEEVDRGLADKRLDHRDRLRILDEIDQAERALATLRSHLTEHSGA